MTRKAVVSAPEPAAPAPAPRAQLQPELVPGFSDGPPDVAPPVTRASPPNPRATLRTIAQASGGKFFDTLSDTRLKQIYEKLGSRLGRRKETREIGDFFAGGSAAFLLFGGALSALWFRRVP